MHIFIYPLDRQRIQTELLLVLLSNDSLDYVRNRLLQIRIPYLCTRYCFNNPVLAYTDELVSAHILYKATRVPQGSVCQF